MKTTTFIVIFAFSLALVGCSGMSSTQQRTLSGGAIGAAGGVVAGAIGGEALLGAAVGSAVGAVGGYVYDKHEKSKDAAYKEGYDAGKQSK